MSLVISRKPLEIASESGRSEFTFYTSDGPITVTILSSSNSKSRVEVIAPQVCAIERGDMKHRMGN